MPIIKLDDIHKNYGEGSAGVSAVRGISIDINKGDFLAIMGPSGSGKSTLMNMTGALDVPTSGSIFLEEKNIALMDESALAQLRGKKIGFVFQQFNLIQTLTAKENVMLPMIFQNILSEEREIKAAKILSEVGLGKRMEHKPGQLSGGEQQRVAIARALANDPDVILADEPTGNLDSKTGKEIMGMLDALNKKGKTIIMVTHDSNVAKHAKRTVNIFDGRIK